MTDPLVDSTELATYLGISDIDTDRADLILGLAQDLCETILTPLPDAAAAVVLDIAARAYTNPMAAQAQATGPFSVSHGTTPGGLFLTRSNIRTLRRIAGGGGAFTVDPTPADAGTGLQPWDENVTWFGGVPVLTEPDVEPAS